jgi:hypothetical protein
MPETLTHPASAPPPGGPPVATDVLEPRADPPLWAAALPLLSLLGICALALSSAAKPALADQVTLPILAIMAALFGYAPFLRRVREQHDATSFAFCAAMFVVYGLSRRVTGENGPSLTLIGEAYPISYAALLVVIGALIGAPAWLKNMSGWTRALLGALLLVALLAFAIFRFLTGFYEVGTTVAVGLDPTSLAYLGMQLVEYGALALCCSAVAANARTRHLFLIILPALLLLLWARYRMMPAPAEEEE